MRGQRNGKELVLNKDFAWSSALKCELLEKNTDLLVHNIIIVKFWGEYCNVE